jgi:riboflavin transporter FmnP
VEEMSFRKSIIIANIIIFSALAVMLTSLRAEIPYPLLPYLKFDLAEIPVMIVLFILGPLPSLVTEVIHWIGLTITRGWILGPLMKFVAVVPMIVGFWLGVILYRKFSSGNSTIISFIIGNTVGIVLRVIVTSIANILVLLVVAPEWLEYARFALNSVGIVVTSVFEVLMWTLLLTAIFNILHVPLSSLVAMMLLNGINFRMPNIIKKTWIVQKVKKASSDT